MKMSLQGRVFWRALAFGVVFAAVLSDPGHCGSLQIATISTEPAAEFKKFAPLANYLAKELRADGIESGKVVIAKSVREMATLLRDGKADLFVDSPYPSLAVSRLSGSKFLLRRWKKGIAEYFSVIFSKRDNLVNRLEDLNGKMIAFEEIFSSSGYFLPKTTLIQKGLRMVAKKEHTDPVGPKEVGYVFSNDDETTMVWVTRGKVIAGAMDNQNYLKEARSNLEQLKVLHQTEIFPRQLVSYRSDLPSKLVARIKDVLLSMDATEEGRKTLQEFEKTTRFDELPASALALLSKSAKFVDLELQLR